VNTTNSLLKHGVACLKEGGVETPLLDARLLLADVLGIDQTGLILAATTPLSDEQQAAYRRALERRIDGECVAYIVGFKEFWGLRFAVNPSVLVPRPDTETLVEAALAALPAAEASLLELCTGSGAVAIALKHERPSLSISASDISACALALAQSNAARLQTPVTFIESDLFEKITGVFDSIIANPPYIPTGVIESLPPEVRREPRLALDGGTDGLSLIRRISAHAKKHLKTGGILLMEAAPEQMPFITELLCTGGYQDIHIYKDLAGLERVIGGAYT
jgi:release factor glutamine methyltransferase